MFDFKVYNRRTGQAPLAGAVFARMWPASRSGRVGLQCVIALALFLFTNAAFAHEQWILTPEQIIEFNSKPKPDLYTHWSANNITMIVVFLLFVVGWVRLNYTGARELFPELQARLASYGNHVSPILTPG